MRKPLKFLVPRFDPSFDLPKCPVPGPNAKVLLVGADPRTKDPAIWLEVIEFQDGVDRTQERAFAYFATGEAIPRGWIHRGSMISPGGVYVWHVYEDWSTHGLSDRDS